VEVRGWELDLVLRSLRVSVPGLLRTSPEEEDLPSVENLAVRTPEEVVESKSLDPDPAPEEDRMDLDCRSLEEVMRRKVTERKMVEREVGRSWGLDRSPGIAVGNLLVGLRSAQSGRKWIERADLYLRRCTSCLILRCLVVVVLDLVVPSVPVLDRRAGYRSSGRAVEDRSIQPEQSRFSNPGWARESRSIHTLEHVPSLSQISSSFPGSSKDIAISIRHGIQAGNGRRPLISRVPNALPLASVLFSSSLPHECRLVATGPQRESDGNAIEVQRERALETERYMYPVNPTGTQYSMTVPEPVPVVVAQHGFCVTD